ncbi:MAG: helix-turn-helix domain-containing protein [Tannerellaceae bacterium]|nr:helix-turn-helix domain-containing protein [Tannerellaceae bacterium]
MNMNYIELVNRFWELDESWQFTCCETRLYFYLLRTANRLGWIENWFHSEEKLAANVGVSPKSIKKARDRLVEAGLITFEKGGMGHAHKTRYDILPPKGTPKGTPTGHPTGNPTGTPNGHPLLNKTNQTKYKKEESLTSDRIEKQKKIFVPPTCEEVKVYCESRGNRIRAEQFVNFYASKGWMVGKNRMKDWKAAIRTWEAKEKKGENDGRNPGIQGEPEQPTYGNY